jgi:hypothetical protein
MINSPIEQNIFGKSGIYECLHIAKKSLPYEEYKSKALELDHITEGLTGEEVEELVLFTWNRGSFGKILCFLLHFMVLICSIR